MNLDNIINYEKELEQKLKFNDLQFTLELNKPIGCLELLEWVFNLPIENYSTEFADNLQLRNLFKLGFFWMARWSSLPLECMVLKAPAVTLLISFTNAFASVNAEAVAQTVGNFVERYPNLPLDFNDYGIELSDYIWRLIKKLEKSNSSRNLNELAQIINQFSYQLTITMNNMKLVSEPLFLEFGCNQNELIPSMFHFYEILTKLIAKDLLKEITIQNKVKLLRLIHTLIAVKYFDPILNSSTADPKQLAGELNSQMMSWFDQFPLNHNTCIGRDASIFSDLEFHFNWSRKFESIQGKVFNGYDSKSEYVIQSLKMYLESAYQPYDTSATPTESINDTTLTTNTLPRSIESTNDLLSAEQESFITQVRDLFPELGEGYIQVCLREFNYDLELTIMNILENNLPPHIAELDKSMVRIK